MNIICFGDSITGAEGFAEGDQWPSLLQQKLNAWRRDKFKVYNRGLGGNTTAQGLDRFGDHVVPLLPGILLVQFGFNDANVRDWAKAPRVGLNEFRRNLGEFQRLTVNRGGLCVFIVNHTIGPRPAKLGNGRTYNATFQPYHESVRLVARRLKAPIIDLPRLMRQQRVEPRQFLSGDNLHLTVAGSHTYAELVHAGLRPILRQRLN